MFLIREIRKNKGISQTELAKKAGTSQSFLSRVERGLHDAELGWFVKIAGILGVSVDELIVKKDSTVPCEETEVIKLPIQHEDEYSLEFMKDAICKHLFSATNSLSHGDIKLIYQLTKRLAPEQE